MMTQILLAIFVHSSQYELSPSLHWLSFLVKHRIFDTNALGPGGQTLLLAAMRERPNATFEYQNKVILAGFIFC